MIRAICQEGKPEKVNHEYESTGDGYDIITTLHANRQSSG